MPLYTVTTQSGTLDTKAKAKLAEELTTFHSEYAGVAKNWVHVIFLDYAPDADIRRASRPRHLPSPLSFARADRPNISGACYSACGNWCRPPPVHRTTKSSSAFRRCRRARRWKWRRSCPTSPRNDLGMPDRGILDPPWFHAICRQRH